MLVCFAPGFEDELEGFGNTDLTRKIHALREQIEKMESYVVGLLFSSSKPYKKRKVLYDYRLIVREYILDAQRVLVFCKIFQRHDDVPYRRFLKSSPPQLPNEPGILEAARRYRRSAQQSEVNQTPMVPEEMREWLQPLKELQVGYTDTEYFIHETRSWAKDVKEIFLDTNLGLQLLHQVVSSIVDESLVGQLSARQPGVAFVQSKVGCHVVWGLRDGTKICLLRANTRKPTEEEIADAEAFLGSPNYKAAIRKAYWSLTAADAELWSAIELNNEGNLFLSQEEIDLLNQLSGPKKSVDSRDQRTRNTLPALISGRAGTGKSTMLAYIFASMIIKMVMGNLDGRPVYVTYNQELLENARKTIKGLLRSNSRLRRRVDDVRAKNPGIVARLETAIAHLENDYVLSYRDLLRLFLSPEERDNFNEIDRVDFSHFKVAYQGTETVLRPFENYVFRRGTSPERAFFIIRQFIKGSIGDSEVGADALQDIIDAHEDLTESDRLGVTTEEVTDVFQTVYRGWYEPQLRNVRLWDDQDLVLAATKALEKSDGNRPKIAAIVCDESQDFTPREIRFLVRCCDLIRYDLRGNDRLTIPIVLAGDALQTLSPTGFRWSAVGAILYEEIWAACNLDDLRPENITLETNYRSADGIVKFCNNVQLLRKEIFPLREDSKEIKPQNAWDTTLTPPPQYFNVGWNITIEEVREIAASQVMLLPCEESGERSYIQNDSILAPLLEGRDLLPYAMSSPKAKGREFPQVFLYNFGTHFEREGFGLSEASDDPQDFAREFFFNKLYVAASRAGQSLVIIENYPDASRPQLWRDLVSLKFGSEDASLRLRKIDESESAFAGQIVLAQEGTTQDLSDAPSVVTPEAAQGLLASGITDSDYETIQRAVLWFGILGPDFKSQVDEATAWCHRVKGQFADAVTLFVRSGHRKEAWITALEGSLWEEASRLRSSYSDAPDFEVALVQMMLSSPSDIGSVYELCRTISRAIESDRFRQRRFRTRVWAQVTEQIKSRIALLIGDDVSATEPSLSNLTIEELREAVRGAAYGSNGITSLRAEVGDLFFVERLWSAASDEYGSRGSLSDAQEKRKIYAQAQMQGFPRGLELLARARLMPEIVVAWEAAGCPQDSAWYLSVEKALAEQRDHLRRLDFALAMNNLPHAMTSLNAPELVGSPIRDIMRLKFVKLAATRFDVYELIWTTVDAIGDENAAFRNEVIEIVVLEAVKRWESPSSYGLSFQPFEFRTSDGVPVAAQNAVYRMMKKYDRKVGNQVLDPRWHGRALEFANDWQAAYEQYSDYTDGYASKDIRNFCRAGYMRAMNRFGDTAGAARGRPGYSTENRAIADDALKKVSGWDLIGKEAARRKALYDDDECKDRLFPLVDVPHLIRQGGEEFEETGSFGDFSWQTRNRRTLLSLYSDELFTWMIDPKSGGSVTEARGPDVRRRPDGQFQVDRSGWRIEVKFGRDETRVTISARSVEGSSEEREGRYVFRLRT